MNYYPLTSPQREIWFDQLLHADLPLYNLGGYVRLGGPIDPQRFEQAVNLLVQKHDTLRTRLTKERDDDGLPFQIYVPRVSITVSLHDFSSENHPHEAALTWMQQRFEQPFDLDGFPLFRYDLLKLREDCYYWLKQYYYLIADGWTIALLVRSLADIYNQLSTAQLPVLTAPSYRDYIDDDRAYINHSSLYETQRQYWLAKYQNPPDPLLTPHYCVAAVNQFAGSECQTLTLPRLFYNRLNGLAKDYHATLFQVLLGAIYVYFTRTAQRQDLVIGLPVLNRANARFKQTAGLFVGVSAIRFDFGTDLSFAQLLSKINQTLKRDYRHQRFPLSELKRAVGLRPGSTRLFDVSLSYENHDYDACFDGIYSHTTRLLHPWEQTPLRVFVRDFHNLAAVQLDWVYNLAYFQRAEVEALQQRFQLILEYVLEHADTAIQQIPLLTAQEQAQLLAWNQTHVAYPQDQTIVDLFQTQVAKTPENIAVVFEDQPLTYRDLNLKANQLAHYLMTLGVTAETLVGLAVERSQAMVIGLLGILKAGGAYVPLDPAYPQERLRFMLEDSQVPVLLTQSQLLDRVPASGAKVVLLDQVWELMTTDSKENPERQSGLTNLAYVIYTSGSTGMPKGVAVEQAGLLNLLTWYIDELSLSSSDKILIVSALGFDLTQKNLLTPLLVGASIHLPAESWYDSMKMVNLISTAKITCLNGAPSAFYLFLAADSNHHWSHLSSLRWVVLGGESIQFRQLNDWLLQAYNQVRLLNSY